MDAITLQTAAIISQSIYHTLLHHQPLKNKIAVEKTNKKTIEILMAAYAALVSVMHIIETIKNHPHPPISFDENQLQSLTENIKFLQKFLETHSIDDEGLESRIADAAYAAEDVIESYIVYQIEASKTISSDDFYDGLHKVIQDLNLIQRDTTRFARKTGIKDDDDDQLLHNHYSIRRPHHYTGDEVRDKVMNQLTVEHQLNRQIIPIVGMGGIGKTTLARNIYVEPFIVEYFYLRGWATVSQEYSLKEILLQVILCLNRTESRESLSGMGEDELGVKLHKFLFGRRYLIVLDDIWSIDAWDKVKTFLPDSNDGSAIILTTRLSTLAFQLSDTYLEMSFLDEKKSWNLFCKTTFGEESCPRDLEGIGKKIVENCKGLPLSIVVIGGLLANSKQTQKHWLYIVQNLNSVVNLEDNERCLKILQLSYKELPVHLKPCFLYMGMFPEDYEIYASDLMRLWVAEGFLKPISRKCLEVVAKEYFNDLVDRNLIIVNERGYSGEAIKFKVHDLLLDVCVREAKKHKFLFVAGYRNFSNPRDLNTQRRIVVHDSTNPRVILDWLSHHGTLVRSLTIKYSSNFPKSFNSKPLRVLRVWNLYGNVHVLESTHGIVNSRYISGVSIFSPKPSLLSIFRLIFSLFRPSSYHSLLCSIFRLVSSLFIPSSNPGPPSSVGLLWNIQTLQVQSIRCVVATSEIWKMSQLRHVRFYRLDLPDPPTIGKDDFILENLQELLGVINFKFSEDVVKRMPNIKKLEVCYEDNVDWSSCCLNNLVKLINLESLYFVFRFIFFGEERPSELLENLAFPCSLKKLTLEGTKLDFRDMGTKIGSLPHLQVLRLRDNAFVGAEWETVEGQFCKLKYLEISNFYDLRYWRTESWTHFPCLEHLSLYGLRKLKEIPLEIGETLRSIKIEWCSDSVVFSAKEILKEQEDLGNEGLQVEIRD